MTHYEQLLETIDAVLKDLEKAKVAGLTEKAKEARTRIAMEQARLEGIKCYVYHGPTCVGTMRLSRKAYSRYVSEDTNGTHAYVKAGTYMPPAYCARFGITQHTTIYFMVNPAEAERF